MNSYPVTVEGAKALQEELHRLKAEERPRIIEAIAEARAHGDLKENAEYHAAREEQSFTEGRIQELEAKTSNMQIVDLSKLTNNGKIVFGATVKLYNLQTETEITYKIVGEDEASIKEGRISIGSPIARALIGKEIEDVVTVKAPSGNVDYEIIAIKYFIG